MPGATLRGAAWRGVVWCGAKALKPKTVILRLNGSAGQLIYFNAVISNFRNFVMFCFPGDAFMDSSSLHPHLVHVCVPGEREQVQTTLSVHFGPLPL